MSDSDGEDAMAYFLPNGIADDSPPKRSALTSSFGSIGATRFGGVYGGAPSALDLSAPLYGGGAGGVGLGGSATATPGTAMAAASSSSSSSRSTFLLSDLGGEILTPRGGDAGSTGHAIGGGRHPFAFSGAFASLSAAESEAAARSRLAGGSHGSSASGGLYDRVGTPKGGSSAGFRSDADIFAPSNSATASSATSSSGVYGRATLNANAPAFMASSSTVSSAAAAADAAAPFGSASPSAWPTMNVKPRRAPPGLSKAVDASPSATTDGASLSLPPGLPLPASSSSSHATAFGTYASSSSSASTASLFSGEGVRQFASKLRPSFPSLSDTFRAGGGPESGHDFPSTLSELNAKSMSVEEIQSNLMATALAAANDVVADTPVDAKATARLSTPRKAARSPRRGVEFKSPSTGDEKPREQPNARAPSDPRLRTPTRRNDATPAPTAAHGAASPVTTGSRTSGGDRRGRNARDPAATEGAGRNARAALSEPSTRSGRRGRGGGGGQGTTISETRAGNRSAQPEVATGPVPLPTTSRKKPPSSVSSVGSDDQLVMVSAVAVSTEESREPPAKVKESPRNAKPAAGRNATNAKKATTPAQTQEKRGGAKRQVYREKPSSPEAPKSDNVKPAKMDVTVPVGGSNSDASAVDGPTHDNVDVVSEASTTETQVQRTVEEDTSVAPSAVEDQAEACPPTAPLAPATPPPRAELQKASSSETNELLEELPEPVEDEPTSSSSVTNDEKSPVPESPRPSSSSVPPSTPSRLESDSGSEFPELSSRTVRASDRKTSAKEHKKDKHKKDKSDKKKAVAPAKSNKKEKRDSSSSGKGDLPDDEPFSAIPAKKASVASMVKIAALLRGGRVLAKRSIAAIWSACWFLCTEFADRINLKGFLGWSFSYLESFLAVVFSVVLLLSLHGASFFIRLHRVAFRAVLTHRHVGFCFAFLYAFPFLVQYVFPWAPPWAPVCLWYAFLVQLFCTSGPAAMVATFRIVLPLMFLVEGISHHSFLLDLNGAELLLASFILSAMKTSNLCSPIFLMSLAVQCLSAVFLGSELVVQWFQMTLALYSLHAMAASDEDWAGLGDEEEDLSCRPLSMHHSIADYNYHPAPSAPSVQKTKRLDRRALAYVRGRKLR